MLGNFSAIEPNICPQVLDPFMKNRISKIVCCVHRNVIWNAYSSPQSTRFSKKSVHIMNLCCLAVYAIYNNKTK